MEQVEKLQNSSSKEQAYWPVRLWRNRVRTPVLRELTRGVSAERVAFATVLGLVSSTWPQIGTNPLMALLLAWLFRCNKAVTSGISLVFTPLQYLLMIPYLRLGETILQVPHFATSVPEIISIVFTDPVGSFAILGVPLLHAILGWCVSWCLFGPVLFFPLRALFRRIARTVLPRT